MSDPISTEDAANLMTAYGMKLMQAEAKLAAAQAENRALREALEAWSLAMHEGEPIHIENDEGETDCPQDDTCECPLPAMLRAALATKPDDAALREFAQRVAKSLGHGLDEGELDAVLRGER